MGPKVRNQSVSLKMGHRQELQEPTLALQEPLQQLHYRGSRVVPRNLLSGDAYQTWFGTAWLTEHWPSDVIVSIICTSQVWEGQETKV